MPSPSAFASILVPMDLDDDAANRVTLAVGLADRLSSRLIGTAAQLIEAPLYFESAVAGVASIVELEQRRIADDAARTESEFRRIAAGREHVEWRCALTHPTGYVLDQCRAADLIVTARPGRKQRTPMSVNAGDLVMSAGRPVLFVPPGIAHLSAKRVVVGWKDGREARRAVWDSLPLLKLAEEVFVVSIDTHAQSANDVASYLATHGIEACVLSRPQSSVPIADELVHLAQQEGADLIVTGAYAHSRAREWAFGGVTQDLLDRSPLCCLMAH
jgi:nucleotide-binding universal stress UspA family protein